MAGGLKALVKEVEGLHYLFSETKVLNSEGITDKPICIFFFCICRLLPLFCLFVVVFKKN